MKKLRIISTWQQSNLKSKPIAKYNYDCKEYFITVKCPSFPYVWGLL